MFSGGGNSPTSSLMGGDKTNTTLGFGSSKYLMNNNQNDKNKSRVSKLKMLIDYKEIEEIV